MADDQLVAAARLGDEDAFAALYQKHARYVRAIGRSFLGNNELDDMCQDTFLLAFTRLPSFEGTSSFRTWLTRIAMNQCLEGLRARRQLSNGDCNLVQLAEETVDDGFLGRHAFATTDRELDRLPARLDLERLLRVLTPTQRRVLEMAYLENIPHREIAELLGITLTSTKCKIHRAKRKVREEHKKR